MSGDGAPETAPAEDRRAPDLRLAPLALGAWFASIGALHLSPGQAAALSGAVALLCLVCWRGRRRAAGDSGRLAATLLLGLLLGALSGATSTAAHTTARDAEPLAGWAQARAVVRADVTITEDPRRARGDNSRLWLIRARLDRVRRAADPHSSWVSLNARVLILSEHPGWRGLLPGQRVAVAGRLGPTRGGDLRAATLSGPEPPRPTGAPPMEQRAAGALRAGLRRAAAPLPDDAGGLLPGLAVGDVSRMDPAVEEDFRATGMTHLTAVSGSNVAIVVGAVLLLTAWCRAGPRTAAGLALLALIGFVILVRPQPSVLRAALMGALALVALASGRPRAAVPGLCATVWLLVIIDPELATDLGFALSVLATAGLLLLAPRWRDAMRRRGVPRGAAEALAVPVAAQVACAPVIAAMTGAVSLTAIPANLLAAPAVAPATIAGASAAAVSPLWPDAAEFLAWLGGWPARWLVAVARWGAGVPGGTAYWPGGLWGGLALGLALAALLVLHRSAAVRRALAVVAVAAAVGAVGARTAAPGWPPPGWVVVACDVGQGDALAVRSGDRQAILVDAGPAATPVDRCLRRLGVTTIPLLVISHFHADHVAGLTGALRGRRVAAIAAPRFDEPALARAEVRRATRAIPWLEPTAGWQRQVGDVRLTALGPDDLLTGTRSDPNDNSLVLRIEAAGLTVLLSGDVEVERQQALLTSGEPVRADVLKVPHHGSAHQDREFLAAVDPAVALISVGGDNEYGHPNPSLMRHLAIDGARVFRTDRAGDIAVSVTADGIAVTRRGQDLATRPGSGR